MKRRVFLGLTVVAVMVVIVALGMQKKKELLLLDWAKKGDKNPPPVAVLIELGTKDDKPTNWSSRATVTGAKVLRREGYRFREKDKLIEPDRWEASSYRGLRAPRNPAVARMEGIATIGVVLHLGSVEDDATLTLQPRPESEQKAETISLKDVLGGKQKSVWGGEAVVRLITTATPLVADKTEDDFPAAAHGPDGALWVAYISYTVRDEDRRIEQGELKEQPANFKAYHTPEFADQLFVKYYRDGLWSQPAAVTSAKEDLARCALAVDGEGNAWVAYSANRKGNFDLYARRLHTNTPEAVKNPRPRVEDEQRLTTSATPDLTPVMCTDQEGRVWLACQSWDQNGTASIAVFRCDKQKWAEVKRFSGTENGTNCWHAALAAGPEGQVAVAYDCYTTGNYDIRAAVYDGKKWNSHTIAGSDKFEARPSLAYDTKGRLWIAYEEGPELWGKDYGILDSKDGNPLYNTRSVRVVCLEEGKLKKPKAELPTWSHTPPQLPSGGLSGTQFERATRHSGPALGLDGKGRIWLTYREKFGSRYSSHPGSYWLSFARMLEGDRWTDPIEIHHSDGLLDHRPVVLPHGSGAVRIIHNTDGRYTTPLTIDNQVYSSVVYLPGEPVEPELMAHEPGEKKNAARHKQETDAVKRIQDYRIEVGGKKYQLLRGEFHRHTEISWDGGPDGSLEDMFRYAIDAAGMDWIGNGDHDNGAGREYPWWLTQKYTDGYHVAKRFTPMFTYERSVRYPHGHRNCMFVQRGVRTLPRLQHPDPDKRVGGIHADDTKMLYRYLREMDGICAIHTSATSMGTDWRDNDPQVEPIVEIYQGDRMSYEKEEAPRAGYDPKTNKFPANIAGWYPLGFVDNAFSKGYKLGFQASSDHWSTHISYCIAVSETHDRPGILGALKKRHCYGATDDIIVNLRSGDYLMGDSFKTRAAPSLEMHVIGTGKLAKIDILKDSQVVHTINPDGSEYRGTWTDPRPTEGTHYYYIRVVQANEELAWASPLWIEFAR